MTAARRIAMFQSAPHPCGYWPERVARDVLLDPRDPALPALYAAALAQGFRRSGGHVYRPTCEHCHACIPVRLAVREFVPNRSQRRCARRNADLSIAVRPVRRSEEHFALYRRYLDTRHHDGGMDGGAPADFDAFVSCAWSPTRFIEFRHDNRLVAVAVTDVLPDALSAVYTFYDPDHAARSLGTFAVLSQIAHARAHGASHLYLGFWLAQHPKMHYKAAFRPLQALVGGAWTVLTPV